MRTERHQLNCSVPIRVFDQLKKIAHESRKSIAQVVRDAISQTYGIPVNHSTRYGTKNFKRKQILLAVMAGEIFQDEFLQNFLKEYNISERALKTALGELVREKLIRRLYRNKFALTEKGRRHLQLMDEEE